MSDGEGTGEQLTYARNDDEGRFEIYLGTALAGFSEFKERGDRITFLHTEVFDRYEGQGIGSQLARFVLDDAVARGMLIVPRCPFIAAYLRRHEEYEDHVRWPPRTP